jgi:hypothetical protein
VDWVNFSSKLALEQGDHVILSACLGQNSSGLTADNKLCIQV